MKAINHVPFDEISICVGHVAWGAVPEVSIYRSLSAAMSPGVILRGGFLLFDPGFLFQCPRKIGFPSAAALRMSKLLPRGLKAGPP